MKYSSMKLLIYVALGLMGVLLVALSGSPEVAGPDQSVTDSVMSLIMLISGLFLCLFSLVTFLIREDTDLWR